MEDMPDLATVASVQMLLEAHVSIVGTLFLQIFVKHWMLFLSNPCRDANLVMPLRVRRSAEASELSFMLLEDFNHPLKA